MTSEPRAIEAFSEDTTPTGATCVKEETTSVGEKTPWTGHVDPGPTSPQSERDLDRLEDRYEVYEEIARGGMASVHLGRSIEPGAPRAVAIKKLHSDLAHDPAFVAMFVDEARLAARVHHPNVVAPRDYVVRAAQGELCLVMEYVHGETLSQLVARAIRKEVELPPAVAVGIMVGVLRGLHAAHEATTDEGVPLQMVHRDVSPQNIMVGTDGLARVLDFGVAKATTPGGLSDQRELAGKPGYLAPEQLRFEDVDRRSDIFAAGVVLWELLAGRRLFRHSDPRIASVNILSGDIPPPSHFNPAVSPALDAAVLRALERDRDQRYTDSRTFGRAISEALRPAGVSEVGEWVTKISGYLLNKRAVRIAQIMTTTKDRTKPAVVTSHLLGLSQLFPQTRRGRRWTILGLVLVALAALAPATGSQSGPRQWTSLSTANAAATSTAIHVVPQAAPEVVPDVVPPTSPATDLETAPPSEAAAPLEDHAPVAAPAETKDGQEETVIAVRAAETGPISEAVVAVDEKANRQAKAGVRRNTRLARAPEGRATPLATALTGISTLHSRALAAYDRADYEGSRRLLRAALALCATSRLAGHPIAAATHIYMGVVLVGGFKQPELGIEEFRRALKIHPDMLLSSRYATPTLSAAFQQAVDRS